MNITAIDAEQIALDFLISEWEIPAEEQEWFVVLQSRLADRSWYIVEVGVEGLPDKWFFQVFDTGYCDPNYTFHSPIKASHGNNDLVELPERLAAILISERKNAEVP